jgi:hypothetical protein
MEHDATGLTDPLVNCRTPGFVVAFDVIDILLKLQLAIEQLIPISVKSHLALRPSEDPNTT